MDRLSLESAVVVPEDVVFRDLDGEAVVLNLETGIYFGLDQVGTRIWQLLEEHRTLAAVRDALHVEYDAPLDLLQSDLLAFVRQLVDKQLLAIA